MPEQDWLFRVESGDSSHSPQNIELLVAEQERVITARETEIRVAIAGQNNQLEFKHIPTDLEEK